MAGGARLDLPLSLVASSSLCSIAIATPHAIVVDMATAKTKLVRIGTATHRTLKLVAKQEQRSMTTVLNRAVEAYAQRRES